MATSSLCRCCLVRPPDRDLKTSYIKMGMAEIYSDMLKECFEIHLSLDDDDDNNNGICDVCIIRLREACSFKSQVQKCQKELADRIIKDEEAQVKEEVLDTDDENAIYFLELKDELSDFEDDKTLAEVSMYNMKEGAEKKKKQASKKASPLSEKVPDYIPMHWLHEAKFSSNAVTTLSDNMFDPGRILTETMKYTFNINNIVRKSNCTPFFNKSVSGIMCFYCRKTLPDINSLRSHNKIHEHQSAAGNTYRKNLMMKIDITDLECNICHAKIDRISDLKEHLNREHDVKFYFDIKDYVFEFKLTDDPMSACALCDSKYETFKMLLQHMNSHYRNFICNICGVGFINKLKLNIHRPIHEAGEFSCAYCDKMFSSRLKKASHEKKAHIRRDNFRPKCLHCDKTFMSYYQRNKHMVDQHNSAGADYKCNICGMAFIMKSHLTMHTKRVHLMERNVICPECGKAFFSKSHLKGHMVTHQAEKPFKCSLCHKAFSKTKYLRGHMRVHNDDRRHKCGICSLAFIQRCSLKGHMLSNHNIPLHLYEAEASQAKSTTP